MNRNAFLKYLIQLIKNSLLVQVATSELQEVQLYNNEDLELKFREIRFESKRG